MRLKGRGHVRPRRGGGVVNLLIPQAPRGGADHLPIVLADLALKHELVQRGGAVVPILQHLDEFGLAVLHNLANDVAGVLRVV